MTKQNGIRYPSSFTINLTRNIFELPNNADNTGTITWIQAKLKETGNPNNTCWCSISWKKMERNGLVWSRNLETVVMSTQLKINLILWWRSRGKFLKMFLLKTKFMILSLPEYKNIWIENLEELRSLALKKISIHQTISQENKLSQLLQFLLLA